MLFSEIDNKKKLLSEFKKTKKYKYIDLAMTDRELKRKSVSSISTSQDNFLIRYSQLLAQMLYARKDFQNNL